MSTRIDQFSAPVHRRGPSTPGSSATTRRSSSSIRAPTPRACSTRSATARCSRSSARTATPTTSPPRSRWPNGTRRRWPCTRRTARCGGRPIPARTPTSRWKTAASSRSPTSRSRSSTRPATPRVRCACTARTSARCSPGTSWLAEGPAAQDGEFPDFARQLNAIGENLLTLPPDTRVLPGHGPETTIATAEKQFDSWVAGRVPARSSATRRGGPDGAAGLRGDAAAALHLHADPAVHLAGLPAPVPDELPGPAAAAQGPAVGAQQPRRQRAQRPGRLVAAAAGPAHRRGRGQPGGPRLDQRGLRGRDPVGAPARARHRHGGGLRRRARPGRRAARRGADGRDPHRHDRASPAGSTASTPGPSSSWSTTRPGGTC